VPATGTGVPGYLGAGTGTDPGTNLQYPDLEVYPGTGTCVVPVPGSKLGVGTGTVPKVVGPYPTGTGTAGWCTRTRTRSTRVLWVLRSYTQVSV
jgi:hypothetical protein